MGSAGKAFVKLTVSRSPGLTRIVGPTSVPLYVRTLRTLFTELTGLKRPRGRSNNP
jgi:hypothetical protein